MSSNNNKSSKSSDDDVKVIPANLDDDKSASALAEVASEAREHLDVGAPDIDWSRLEARVMAAVEKEKPAVLRDVERQRASRSRRDNALRAGAFVLAAAAAVAFVVRKDRDVLLPGDGTTTPAQGTSASSLRSTEGTGEIRVTTTGGAPAKVATPGYVVRAGDSIEADGARAVFERSQKVTWLLEQDRASTSTSTPTQEPVARTRVKSAGESLILGLENGVIEAQVVPVPTGEAFAVDIATDRGVVRVAVHGTHLRVARAGNRVVVDLTEGVVSIGVPPRTGVTYGTLVTAPAHVELDATDLTTLRVDHGAASVRSAIPLGMQDVLGSRGPANPTTPTQPLALQQQPVVASKPATGSGAVARPLDEKATTNHAKVEPPKAVLPPRDEINKGIRECATSVKSRSAGSGDGLHITVSSSLKLKVSPSGTVESAQFSPPLLPDIQTCAAQVIYKTKLEETGLVTIPIEFSY